MPRSYYSNYISNFLVESTESILGKLTRNNQFEEQRKQQRNAWISRDRNSKGTTQKPRRPAIFCLNTLFQEWEGKQMLFLL